VIARTPLVLAALVAVLVATPRPAPAAKVAKRTVLTSGRPDGRDANGDARHAAISGNGRVVAFDSDATTLTADPDGAIRDVFTRDLRTGTTTLVSKAPGGGAADGPSSFPALSRDGTRIAFASAATNLVATDSNGVDDVFVATPSGIVLASLGDHGQLADGPSSEPDISADGRFVTFSSTATNLVPGDANGHVDVFVRDLLRDTIQLVSKAAGASAAGKSHAPAISPDGRWVSFWSDAPDLAAGDRNGVGDVFLANLATGGVRLVSRSSTGAAQDRSVTSPFVQVSDVSRDGELVAFDSDATTLVPGDTNRSTDVFVRDVHAGRTTRVSISATRRQADNDSFYPTISPNGRFVAFESFAGNLSHDDGHREDLFVFDRHEAAPVLLDVPAAGGRKGGERIRQLLQRPAVSDDGERGVFSSTAGNLTSGDDNRRQDVFARILTAPRATIGGLPETTRRRARERYTVTADDPAADAFRCAIDGRAVPCGRLPVLKRGPHELTVAAGGPGMLWQRRPATRAFTVR
jgi:Tol biopolymer transport system component